MCGSEYVQGAVVLLVVEPGADLAADLLPAPQVDLVHHVHRNRVQDRQAQRLRSTQRITLDIMCVCVCMYVCNVCSQYIHIHTDIHRSFERLYKYICMHMYVCMSEVSGRQCGS